MGWYCFGMDLLNLFGVLYTGFLTAGGVLAIAAGITEALSADRKWLRVFGLFLFGVLGTIGFGQAFIRFWIAL